MLSGLSSQMSRLDKGGGLGSIFKKGHKDKRTSFRRHYGEVDKTQSSPFDSPFTKGQKDCPKCQVYI